MITNDSQRDESRPAFDWRGDQLFVYNEGKPKSAADGTNPGGMMPAFQGVLETSLYVADLQRSKRFFEALLDVKTLAADERFCALNVWTDKFSFSSARELAWRPSTSPAAPSRHTTGTEHFTSRSLFPRPSSMPGRNGWQIWA
jgi:hypothetical protein